MRAIKRCPNDGQENDLGSVECAVCFGPLRYWCPQCHQWLADSNCAACAERESAAERIRYWYAKNGRQVGPVSTKELQSLVDDRKLARSDLTWQEGAAGWIPAERLAIVFPPPPPPVPSPPPPPAPVWIRRFLPSSTSQIKASMPPKEPITMALLSGLLLPGLGQIILGQTAKGLAMLGVSFTLIILTAGFGVVMWPISAFDAYLTQAVKGGPSHRRLGFFQCNYWLNGHARPETSAEPASEAY